MGVAVYPRLHELLSSRELSVAELERQIAQRFGLSVDPKTLYRLTSGEPVQRADLEIAGAVAAVLGVGLDDLFDVRAVRVDEQLGAGDLEPAASRRLAELFAGQARGALSQAEEQELEQLVGEYGRRLHERRLREIADQRGISLDAARREVSASLDQALAWWQEFESDPANRVAVTARARRGRKRSGA